MGSRLSYLDKEPKLDLKEYMGVWYEIIKMPSYFEDSFAKNTFTRYSLNDDGTVNVYNQETLPSGAIKSINSFFKR